MRCSCLGAVHLLSALGLSSSSDAARDDVRNSAERDASDQHAALHAAPSSRLSGSSPSLLAAGKAQYHARSCPHELARPPRTRCNDLRCSFTVQPPCSASPVLQPGSLVSILASLARPYPVSRS
ncbi:hypothetical protein PaG_02328 [Moesziomyces aphidis]|uniref:Secreted protein n=1 Tax=Moesziomyces aphidis TaxID=84754 RepID=W3VT63_MOEAP|nr:hypothetical protein PaG_02328 [Moesziomyces aphidis]